MKGEIRAVKVEKRRLRPPVSFDPLTALVQTRRHPLYIKRGYAIVGLFKQGWRLCAVETEIAVVRDELRHWKRLLPAHRLKIVTCEVSIVSASLNAPGLTNEDIDKLMGVA